MRVLICPDRMGSLTSAAAGRALAAGWPGATVRPVGEAGRGFAQATADGWRTALQTAWLEDALLETAVSGSGEIAVLAVTVPGGAPAVPETPIPHEASSLVLGRAIEAVLTEHRPRRLLVDLAGIDVHDAGAGMLAGLGASAYGAELTGGVAALSGLAAIDLAPVRDRLVGVELVGVVPSTEREHHLLGLRGITSRRGRAAAEDPARLLATDAALQRLTELASPTPAASTPGAGACGGLGWTVLMLGGRLASGPELCLDGVRHGQDLVVTGSHVFDFATRGGGVVAAAAELAAEALAPCIVVAGEVLIGAREMRTLGIEAAYPIHESVLDQPTGGDVSQAQLVATVMRVSRSWRW